jgi:hypothetical protein
MHFYFFLFYINPFRPNFSTYNNMQKNVVYNTLWILWVSFFFTHLLKLQIHEKSMTFITSCAIYNYFLIKNVPAKTINQSKFSKRLSFSSWEHVNHFVNSQQTFLESFGEHFSRHLGFFLSVAQLELVDWGKSCFRYNPIKNLMGWDWHSINPLLLIPNYALTLEVLVLNCAFWIFL